MIPINITLEERKIFTDTLEKIVSEISPEKIICFGSRTDYHESWSNFLPTGNMNYFTYYDILIATKEANVQKEHEILEKIAAYNKGPIHITALVHSMATVNKAILKGNPFFVTVYKKGMIVYDSENVPLSIPDKELDVKKLNIRAERHWQQLFGLAEVYFSRGLNTRWDQNEIALFMFHQSVEYACQAIIKYCTGYRPMTHDLKRLLFLMENFIDEKIMVFSDEQETKDIDTLFNIYKDVRHCRKCKVYNPTIGIVRSRVRRFLEIVAKIHDEKKKLLKELARELPTSPVKE